MTRASIERRVLDIASKVLGEELLVEASMGNTSSWDSLARIDLVFAIEEEFGIEFAADSLSRLDSIVAIVEELEFLDGP